MRTAGSRPESIRLLEDGPSRAFHKWRADHTLPPHTFMALSPHVVAEQE